MQNKSNRMRRSRLAEVGSRSINYSQVSEAPQQLNESNYYQYHHPESSYFSAFKNRRKTDPLRDLQTEVEGRWMRYFRADNERRRMESFQRQRRLTQKQSIETGRSIERSVVNQHSDLKNEISELKMMMSKVVNKPDITQQYLQRKIKQLMPREKAVSQPMIPQYIPIPMYQPPMQPYAPQPPQQMPLYPQQYPPQANTPQFNPPNPQTKPEEKPQKPTKKKDFKKILRKVIRVVSYPVFLKNKAKQLLDLRRDKFAKTIDQSLQVSTISIRNWFLESCNKAISILIEKKDISMDFREETDQLLLQMKLNLISEVLEAILNGLNNTKNEQINDFIDFLQLTCTNKSLIVDDFLTQKQIGYLNISQEQGFIRANKNIEEIQIIVFVFIKMLVYNLMLQPWKFDEKLKTKDIIANMMLIGCMLYHCANDIITKKLQLKQQYKGGNLKGKYEYATFLYNDAKNETNQYISGLPSKEDMTKLISHNSGKVYKSMGETMQKLVTKIHKQMKEAKKAAQKQLLEEWAS